MIGASEKASFVFSRATNKKSGIELAQELDESLKKQGLLAPDRGIQGDSLVSDTGEVIRDFGKGLLIVNTPRTQGFTGFPKGELTFRDISVTSRTMFTTILVSSLDGAGLDTAKKMLLTVIARAENDKDNMQYASFVKAPNGMIRGEYLTVAHPQPGLGTVRVEPTDATVRPLRPAASCCHCRLRRYKRALRRFRFQRLRRHRPRRCGTSLKRK